MWSIEWVGNQPTGHLVKREDPQMPLFGESSSFSSPVGNDLEGGQRVSPEQEKIKIVQFWAFSSFFQKKSATDNLPHFRLIFFQLFLFSWKINKNMPFSFPPSSHDSQRMVCSGLRSLIDECTVILGWCYTAQQVEQTKRKQVNCSMLTNWCLRIMRLNFDFQEGLMQEALGKIFKDFDVKVRKKLFFVGKKDRLRLYMPIVCKLCHGFFLAALSLSGNTYLAFLSI